MAVNPYKDWLGIAGDESPDHYRLLGIERYEQDLLAIEVARDQAFAKARQYESSKHSDVAVRLMGEISQAFVCLADPARKSEYDAELRSRETSSGDEALIATHADEVFTLEAVPERQNIPLDDAIDESLRLAETADVQSGKLHVPSPTAKQATRSANANESILDGKAILLGIAASIAIVLMGSVATGTVMWIAFRDGSDGAEQHTVTALNDSSSGSFNAIDDAAADITPNRSQAVSSDSPNARDDEVVAIDAGQASPVAPLSTYGLPLAEESEAFPDDTSSAQNVAASNPNTSSPEPASLTKDDEPQSNEPADVTDVAETPPAEPREPALPPGFHQWVSADGKYQVRAKLLEFNGERVKLRDEQGKEIDVPLDALSAADQDFAKREDAARRSAEVDDMLATAFDRLARHRIDEAREALQLASRISDVDCRADFCLGLLAALVEQDESEAKRRFHRCTDGVAAAAALNNLAMIELRSGNASTAVRFLQQAIAIDPRNDDVHHNFGLLERLEAEERIKLGKAVIDEIQQSGWSDYGVGGRRGLRFSGAIGSTANSSVPGIDLNDRRCLACNGTNTTRCPNPQCKRGKIIVKTTVVRGVNQQGAVTQQVNKGIPCFTCGGTGTQACPYCSNGRDLSL